MTPVCCISEPGILNRSSYAESCSCFAELVAWCRSAVFLIPAVCRNRRKQRGIGMGRSLPLSSIGFCFGLILESSVRAGSASFVAALTDPRLFLNIPSVQFQSFPSSGARPRLRMFSTSESRSHSRRDAFSYQTRWPQKGSPSTYHRLSAPATSCNFTETPALRFRNLILA